MSSQVQAQPRRTAQPQAGRRSGAKAKTKKEKSFYDYTLLFTVIFLCCFGLVMVFSASYYMAALKQHDSMYFVKRQGGFMFVGLILAIIISKVVNYHWLGKWKWLLLGLSFVMMILTNYTSFGIEINGQKRWFGIAGHGIFQTSELVKITVLIFMAFMLVIWAQKVDTFKGMLLFAACVLPLVLLVMHKNLSTGIIIGGIAFVMFFIASKKKGIFALIAIVGLLGVTFIVLFTDKLAGIPGLGYRLGRVLAWRHPEQYMLTTSMQTMQGMYAIGSGGLFGKGLGNSIQKLGFVPEAQNDMIFTIICEELGLFGAFAVILLFGFMIYRLFIIARNAPDREGFFLATGIMAHISIQVILNIAVVTNVIPNTGVTLPFFSYGGTAIIFLMVEMGIALSVSNQIRGDGSAPARNLNIFGREKKPKKPKRAKQAAVAARNAQRGQAQDQYDEYYDDQYADETGYYQDGYDAGYDDEYYQDGEQPVQQNAQGRASRSAKKAKKPSAVRVLATAWAQKRAQKQARKAQQRRKAAVTRNRAGASGNSRTSARGASAGTSSRASRTNRRGGR